MSRRLASNFVRSAPGQRALTHPLHAQEPVDRAQELLPRAPGGFGPPLRQQRLRLVREGFWSRAAAAQRLDLSQSALALGCDRTRAGRIAHLRPTGAWTP